MTLPFTEVYDPLEDMLWLWVRRWVGMTSPNSLMFSCSAMLRGATNAFGMSFTQEGVNEFYVFLRQFFEYIRILLNSFVVSKLEALHHILVAILS